MIKQTVNQKFNPNKVAVSLTVKLLMNLFSIALTYIDENSPFLIQKHASKISQTLPKNQIHQNDNTNWLAKAVQKMNNAIFFIVIQNILINRKSYVNNHFFLWAQITNLNNQYRGIFNAQNIAMAEKLFLQNSNKRRLSNFINPRLQNSYNIIRIGLLNNRAPGFNFQAIPKKIETFFSNKLNEKKIFENKITRETKWSPQPPSWFKLYQSSKLVKPTQNPVIEKKKIIQTQNNVIHDEIWTPQPVSQIIAKNTKNSNPKNQSPNSNFIKKPWTAIPTQNRFQILEDIDLDSSFNPTPTQAYKSPIKDSLPKTSLSINKNKNPKKRIAGSPIQNASSSPNSNYSSSSESSKIKPAQQYIQKLATINLTPKNNKFDFEKDFQPLDQPYILQYTSDPKFNKQLEDAFKQNHNIAKPLITIRFTENKISSNILLTAAKNTFSKILSNNYTNNIKQVEIIITDVENFITKHVAGQLERLISYSDRFNTSLFLTIPQNEIKAAASTINTKFTQFQIDENDFFPRATENLDPV
jgi:hypothetical protein